MGGSPPFTLTLSPLIYVYSVYLYILQIQTEVEKQQLLEEVCSDGKTIAQPSSPSPSPHHPHLITLITLITLTASPPQMEVEKQQLLEEARSDGEEIARLKESVAIIQ